MGLEILISVNNDKDVDVSLNFEDDDKALDHDNQVISPHNIGNVTVSTFAGDVIREKENVETLKLIVDRKKRPSKGYQSHEDTNGKKAEFASDWDLHDSTTKPGRLGDAMSAPKRRKSRWDETPVIVSSKVEFDFVKELPGGLLFMTYMDYLYFGDLLKEEDEVQMSPDEQKEREILKLLLKLKYGTSPQQKTALTQLTDEAREFGAGPLFNKILPLLMHPTLDDKERHVLVNLINRLICELDELVRPQAHKILVLIEPLLVDEDYDARVQGRELISNLCKAVGLNTMIDAMRPDIDNIDEYVRNTTARAFSVVASTLGIPALLPFLQALCQSKQSWRARYTGIKIVEQIAILIGCAALPHLKSLVEIIEYGLNDENHNVRSITALSFAALAESSAP